LKKSKIASLAGGEVQQLVASQAQWTHEEQSTAEDKDREKSPAIGRSSDPTDVDHNTDSTPAPLPRSNTKQKKGKGCAKQPKQDDATPTSDEERTHKHPPRTRADHEEEELEPLHKSLVPEITRTLATGGSGQKSMKQKIEGGNGDYAAESDRPAESQASSSKKASTSAIN
ncbi:unnamed protein product, partial [Rhizoctonia solani]